MANFRVDTDGNLWIGTNISNNFATAKTEAKTKFYVEKDGTIKATAGTIGGIVIDADGIESDNYDAASQTGWRLDNSTGIAQYFDIDIVLENTSSGSPSATQRIDIGNSQIFDLGNQGLTISTTAVRASKFKAIAVGTASNPPIAIAGDYAELGFFATNDTSVGGFTTMHATNGTSDVFHWNSTGTNVTFHGDVVIEGNQLSVNGDTGGNNQFLGYNGSGTLGFHTVSGSSHPDSDHTTFAVSSHNHDGDYVDTVSGSTDALSISGRNITLNFGTTGTRVAAGNHNHDGDYSTGAHLQLVSSGGTNGTSTTAARSNHDHGLSTHTHTSVLSFSANQINIYGSVKPSSNNSRTIGTSSSLRFADMYSQEFYGQYFYGTLINSSSENVKTNIADTGLGLDFIEALPIKQFNYITEGHSDKKYTGVIAEDVQNILDANGWDDYYLVVNNSDTYRFNNRCQHPAICTCGNEDCEEGNYSCQDDCCSSYFKYTEEDETITNWIHHTVEECEAFEVDGNRHPHFNYYQLVGPLVKSVQELSTQISDLTARVEALEG